MKKAIIVLLLLFSISYLLMAQKKRLGYNPENYPQIITEKDFDKEPYVNKLHGFIGWNYQNKDFSQLSFEFLAMQSFNSYTKWPKENKKPEKFNPDMWLEVGKDPGLGIKKLHEKGIAGDGISIAVIDKCINPNHKEFLGRVIYRQISIPLAKDSQYKLHFHGIACASILCGKNCGIAPEAKLFYFAVPDDGRNFVNYCIAMEEIIETNINLPEDLKIKLVSISDGIGGGDDEVIKKWKEMLSRAREQNIAVIYSNNSMHSIFSWGGCLPYTDRNNAENYDYSTWPKSNDEKAKEKIILPADFRTTASNIDNETYVYWGGDSGLSWAIPYFAGLATLAWSVNKDITFEKIFKLITITKTLNKQGRYVVNPQGFINAVIKSLSTTPGS